MKKMGYLMVDHRASPGLPENIARWAGYNPKQVGEGKFYEVDTLCCSHCNACVVPNVMRSRPRALCMECDNFAGHYICDPCDFARNSPGYTHRPFKKAVDEHLNHIVKMGSPSKLIF